MCTAANRRYIQTARGRRDSDGTFTPNSKLIPGAKWEDRHGPKRPPRATDVPLGEGLADNAKLSILTRRERIREAVSDE